MEPKRLLTNSYCNHTTIPLYLNKKDKGLMENEDSLTTTIGLPNFNNEGQIQSLVVNGRPHIPYEDGYVLSQLQDFTEINDVHAFKYYQIRWFNIWNPLFAIKKNVSYNH